ncbi:hypothetical protein GCM10009793_34920 [Brachybacterium phenoliresistens]
MGRRGDGAAPHDAGRHRPCVSGSGRRLRIGGPDGSGERVDGVPAAALCPKFGLVSIGERKKLRGSSIAGTVLFIHGIVATVAGIWRNEDKDLACRKRLAKPAKATRSATLRTRASTVRAQAWPSRR